MKDTTIEKYGQSEFLKLVAGKPANEVWLLIDELVEAVAVLNPKLYENFMTKLSGIRG